ncbi:SapC family protein [Thalassotalea insulae]|uniref:SapC family protein n=1 Tax=Thalassotalea insulae TaxID=2056778 RepID=A0ABQ6GSX8_9GAMM|nr:SapC family protein [Thalassotalea insulae]GLX79058.1 SapC family protein [Thalassotalea insulae]
MTRLVAVTPKQHQDIQIDKQKVEAHGAELNLIPVVTAEFTNLATQYPIVLTKNGDTGEFVCAAMLGFEAKENLFWQNGQWQSIYLPLQIQRQPFFIGNSNGEATTTNQDYVVCLDSESPAIVNSPSTSHSGDANPHLVRLFTDNGEESDYFQQIKQTLAHILQGEQHTKAFIKALNTAQLIQPLSLEVTFADQQSTRLNGLYTIDQQKLAALTTEQVGKLHRDGWLAAIYTIITSLGQIYSLIERKNQRLTN